MRANKQFFIFSVQHKTNSEKHNRMNHKLAQKLMSDIDFKDVDGYYDGFTEHAYLVPAAFESEVMEYAAAAGQDSVLFVDSMRNGYLIFLNGDTIKLDGKFQRVDRDKALTLDAFTRCPETNTYWAIV